MMIEVTAKVVGDDGSDVIGMHQQRMVPPYADLQEALVEAGAKLLEDIDDVKRAVMDQTALLSAFVQAPLCDGASHGRRAHQPVRMRPNEETGRWECPCGAWAEAA
jgi:hypothetical protein